MSNFKIPLEDYIWPRSNPQMAPYKEQVKTVEFGLQYKRFYNLSEIGTGKTMAHLWLADYLMINDKVKQVLIVTPLSTVHAVWGAHIFQHFPHRSYRIAHGNLDTRLHAINSNADFIIINHDGVKISPVMRALSEKIRGGQIGLIIIDELTAFKNNTTQRTKAMQKIARSGDIGIHGLTGTPTPNGPTEAFGQAHTVNPYNKSLPRYFSVFRSMVEMQVSPVTFVPTPDAYQIVNRVLQPAIRFTRDECVSIPPCYHIERIVEFSPKQRKAYEIMRDKLKLEFQSGLITAANAAVKLNKLLQIAAGDVKDDEGKIIHVDSKPRDDALWDLFQESGSKKLIVFAAHVATILRLTEYFKSKKVKVASIYGATPLKERSQSIHKFQNEDLQVLVIQPQSTAHGVTLTAANVIVWYSLISSGEVYTQANGRITRAGQTKKQLIYHFIGSKAEKRLLKLQEDKTSSAKSVLDLFKNI